MDSNKITEFLAVLACALLIGSAAILSIMYLEGAARGIAILGVLVAALIAWQYLRRRFGRS